MDLVIRPVRLDDAEGVVRVLNAVIEAGRYTVFDTPLTAEAERAYIADLPERAIFLVAECLETRRIVGWQSMEPYAGYTRAFDHVAVLGTYVDSPERRRGVGRRLSEASFQAARRVGYEKLFTYVRADNPGGLAFYQALGFRIVGIAQRQARLGGRYIDEVIIERPLL